MVRLLLEHGADPNAAVESSGNCLWAARSHPEIYRLVEAAGGRIPLHLACYDGDLERVRKCLRETPEASFTEECVHYAVTEGHPELLAFIAEERPAALQMADVSGARSAEEARWLLQHGASPCRVNWLGVSGWHRIAGQGRLDLAEVCAEAGFDWDARDFEYQATPLGWAERSGQTAMADWLRQSGAKS
jgi:ankyrin repeat protein